METMFTDYVKKLIIPSLTLVTGRSLKGYAIDPTTSAPPGFIALKNPDIPDYVEFVKVSSIANFMVSEDNAGLLWHYFDVLPEPVQIRRV